MNKRTLRFDWHAANADHPDLEQLQAAARKRWEKAQARAAKTSPFDYGSVEVFHELFAATAQVEEWGAA